MSRYYAIRSPLPPDLEQLTGRIIGACIEVHRALGPGLLESVYELCAAEEFAHQGIPFDRQLSMGIQYRDLFLDSGLRLDFLVNNTVVLELKAAEQILPVHKAQVLSYLKLANKPVGLLVNFNVAALKSGIHRIINPDHPLIRKQEFGQDRT